MIGTLLLRLFGMDDRPPKVPCPHCGRPWRPPVEVGPKDPVALFLDDQIDVARLEREVGRMMGLDR